MQSAGLREMDIQGSRFSWNNMQIDEHNIQERLDHVLANQEWNNTFLQAQVHSLPYFSSDHRPLLVYLFPKVEQFTKPFRYEAYWHEEPKMDTIIKENWCHFASSHPGEPLSNNLRNIQKETTLWRKFELGHIRNQKHQALQHLKTSQLEFEQNPSRANLHKGVAYYRQFRKWAAKEKTYWAQRTHENWAKWGD